jgi:hypothetical protein
MTTPPPFPGERRRKFPSALKFVPIGVVAVLLTLEAIPYYLIASPKSTIKIVDESDRPIPGMRIVRSWKTSEHQEGRNGADTDGDGTVNFPEEAFPMSRLTCVTKSLLTFIPANCSPFSEVYAESDYRVYCPVGYSLRLDSTNWTQAHELWTSRDGTNIREQSVVEKYQHERCVELFFSNKRRAFTCTLKFCKEKR